MSPSRKGVLQPARSTGVRRVHKFNNANEHIAAGLIWASLCAAVLKRFLAHAAQIVGGKPISTRRVSMCAGHIIDELVVALLACASFAEVFRDGIAFLLANARRANPKRDLKWGDSRAGSASSEPVPKVITLSPG